MGFRRATILLTASGLAACAGPFADRKPAEDDVFSLRFADAKPSDDAPPATSDATQIDAVAMELSFERSDGRRLSSPRITTYVGQTARVTMLSTPPGLGGDPRRNEQGMWFSGCPQKTADGAIALGFRLKIARLKKPSGDAPSGAEIVPDRESIEITGARRLEPGAEGMLARVSNPDGSGPLLVLARARAYRVDAPLAAAEDPFTDEKLTRAFAGRTEHLRVTAVQVPRDIEPGVVIDETATPDVMKPMDGRILRDYEVITCVDSRLRIAGLFETGDATRSFVAEGTDDGRLAFSWTTNGAARTASVRPSAGRRFVAVANLEGGGTAGVLVSLDAD